MARELQSLKRRQHSRRQQAGRKKHRMLPVLAAFLIIVGAVCYLAWSLYEQKYGLTKEKADQAAYFGVSGEEVAVFFNDTLLDKKEVPSFFKNGSVYVPFTWIVENLNDRFYWDTTASEILYMLPETVVSYREGEKLDKEADVFIRKGSEKEPYLNLKLVQKYTNVRVQQYTADDYKRIFISTDFSGYIEAELKNQEAVRTAGGVKAGILTELKKGTRVRVLEAMETWVKVASDNGYIGYVRNKSLGEKGKVIQKSEYQTPEYYHIQLRDGKKVVLGFHQVTTEKGNATFDDFTEKTDGMNVIAPTWFTLTDDDGTLQSIADREYVDKAHRKGLQVWAVVNNFDGGEIKEEVFLSDKSKRQHLIDELVTECRQNGIDGINVDFELIPERLGRSYIQFMRELSVVCRREGLILSVDTYVPYEYNSYYDICELGLVCDYVIIMCYDEHYAGSEEGSVSSIGYVRRGIDEAAGRMDADRVIIALPFYTRIWISSEDGRRSEAMGAKDAAAWAEKKQISLSWDQATGQNYGEVRDEEGLKKVWMEDTESLKLKVDAVSQSGMNVAAWRLNQEPEGFWEIMDIN